MAYGLRAKISPGVELHDIHVHLVPDGPPTVKLVGTVRHARTNRLIGQVTIDTSVLGAAGVAFINELKDAFGGMAPARAGASADGRPNADPTVGRRLRAVGEGRDV